MYKNNYKRKMTTYPWKAPVNPDLPHLICVICASSIALHITHIVPCIVPVVPHLHIPITWLLSFHRCWCWLLSSLWPLSFIAQGCYHVVPMSSLTCLFIVDLPPFVESLHTFVPLTTL